MDQIVFLQSCFVSGKVRPKGSAWAESELDPDWLKSSQRHKWWKRVKGEAAVEKKEDEPPKQVEPAKVDPPAGEKSAAVPDEVQKAMLDALK